MNTPEPTPTPNIALESGENLPQKAQDSAPARTTLIGLDHTELGAALTQIGVKDKQVRMRVNQLWNGLYARGLTDFDDLHTISKDLRQTLAQNYTIERPEIVTEQLSNDGTRKWLLRFKSDIPGKPGPEAEMVYIPEETRGTLCISSQVGCTLNCRFCHTGTMPLEIGRASCRERVEDRG